MTRLVAFPILLLAMIVLLIASCARAVDVATCAEFAAVDRKTETEVTITAADFKCDEYTRLSIRTDMVLTSTVGKVTFSNLALKVYGSLTVEPDVVFTGVTLVEKRGGALKVVLGAAGVFKGTAEFNGNSIITTNSSKKNRLKGGAIHNKGSLVFEKDATFASNFNRGVDVGSGPGGAIFVHQKASMHVMGNLHMTGNEADSFVRRGLGGAIHNRGDIVVDGEANFDSNIGGAGGAIYQEKWATVIFNDFVTFSNNTSLNRNGGAVANIGGDFTSEAGSLFSDNVANNAEGGGRGGGIYNCCGGVVTLEGSTTFRNNYASWGAGIFNGDSDYDLPVIVYPEDTVFEDNYGQNCNDVAYERDADTCGLPV